MVDVSHRHCSHSRVFVGVLERMEMNGQPEALRLAEELEIKAKALGFSLSPHAAELRRLHAIEESAKNLVKVKGRFHTEQAFNQLKELLK